MRRGFLGILLVTACTMAQPAPTPASLGAANAEAAATLAAAAAQATQAAAQLAAATERAQATQAAYAFSVTATAQALDAARAQSAATATAGALAIQSTQSAQAAQLAAGGTALAATATAEMIGLQMEQGRLAAEREERNANLYAGVWGLFFVVLLIIVLVFIWVWGKTVAEVWKKRAEVFDNGMVLLVHDGDRWARVDDAPRLLPPPDPAERDLTAASRWQIAILRFAFFGNQVDFSMREMMRAGIVTDPAWRHLTDLMAGAGVLVKGKGGSGWAAGWNYPRFRSEVRHGHLPLPFPEVEPPAVNLPQHTHAPHAPHALPQGV